MSNLATDTNEPGHSPDSHPDHQINIQNHKPHNSIAHYSATFLENSDSFIYAIVGICFFLAGLFALGYSFWDFGSSMLDIPTNGANAAVASAIIKLVSDLLLVLIIMEVLGTVIHYLKSHATSLRPFLFIGIISATRGILSIGARLSVETVSLDEFNRSMIELGVNALAILALGITLKLLGKLVEDHQ
jgi:uncharacterized membrane protein (DUF373 family)